MSYSIERRDFRRNHVSAAMSGNEGVWVGGWLRICFISFVSLIDRLVAGVEADIESMQFNTAIAKMMETLNAFQKLPSYPKEELRRFVLLLSPFAPHIAEECWADLGAPTSLAYAPFPSYNPASLLDDQVTLVVQVNGKVRARLEVPTDTSQEEALAKARPAVASHLDGKEIMKVIHVPNKILNIVVR
jgi:leucyl-tRNA synthetase